MTTAARQSAELRAQIEAVHRKMQGSDRCIGIQARELPERGEIAVGDVTYAVVGCASALAVREALVGLDESEDTRLVVVTTVAEKELGADVLARFAKRRLHRVDPWGAVTSLFQAREIAPAVRSRRWFASVLIESVPPGGYAPVASGVVDEEVAWGVVLVRALGLASGTPDLRHLLEWSLVPESKARLGGLEKAARTDFEGWIQRWTGEAGVEVTRMVADGNGARAIPLGLAFAALATPGRPDDARDAAVRAERWTGDRPVAAHVAAVWTDAAARYVQALFDAGEDSRAVRVLEAADGLLAELRVDHLGYLSDHSPLGFEQRLHRVGEAILKTVASTRVTVSNELLALVEDVHRHSAARRNQGRVNRLGMAMRLLRWLESSVAMLPPPDLGWAAFGYSLDGGFVDWARLQLVGGDPVDALGRAFTKVADRVAELRSAENRRFAELLANATSTGSRPWRALPIENMLDEIVAPAAAAAPVLLIVVDGMSFPVFRELLVDTASHGWVQIALEDGDWPVCAVSALPSITEASRASLFAGRLVAGDSALEAREFAANKSLGAVSKAGHPPVVFHRGILREGGAFELASTVFDAIRSAKQQVVGVVVNAVDDHLTKGSQVQVLWTLESVRVLGSLFQAAQAAGRVVVLTSDHGHVIDLATTVRPGDAGERFRRDDGAPGEGEIAVHGDRVLLPEPGRMIAPYSEDIRYGGKKHGYHGGVTPQECLVPIAVLSRAVHPPKGWVEITSYRPTWWDATVAPFLPILPPVDEAADVVAAAPLESSLPLFASLEKQEAASEPKVDDWIAELLASDLFTQQERMAGKRTPDRTRVERFLRELDKAGGVALKQALARSLELPEIRMDGLIAGIQRLLNVDGYGVLEMEASSGTVRLSFELLWTQFAVRP